MQLGSFIFIKCISYTLQALWNVILDQTGFKKQKLELIYWIYEISRMTFLSMAFNCAYFANFNLLILKLKNVLG